MKTLLISFISLIALTGVSQLQEVQGNFSVNWTPYNQSAVSTNQYKSTTCSVDSVQYTLSKATALVQLNINNTTSASGTSQYFDAPQDITLNGVSFFAWKLDLTGGPTQNMDVEIYLAGLDSVPTGVPLTSAVIAVDTTFGTGALSVLQKTVTFSAPITVNQAYCVVISNNSPNGIGLVANSYAAADGAGEWLSSLNIGGNWLRGYDVNVGGLVFDADWLVYPHASYTLTASASQDQTCLPSGGTMNYTDLSSPILGNRMYNVAAVVGSIPLSYTWDYGDGSPTENLINPSHTFPGSNYTVTLTDTIFGWTTNCSDDTTFNTGLNIVADYSTVTTGFVVDFTDLTVNDDVTGSWLWDFGDGNTSTMQNPSHTYAAPGNYAVCLTSNNSCTTDSVCSTVIISCPTPTAIYSVSTSGLMANFNQTSTSPSPTVVVNWLWDFGDGNTAITQNPSHTYATAGTYAVCLTVTNDCGETDSTCQSISVAPCPAPTPDYAFVQSSSLTIDYTDGSTTTGITSWLWDFGDGNSSIIQNPNHTYATSGAYSVCLTVTDSCSMDSVCQTVNVTAVGVSEVNVSEIHIYPNPTSEELTLSLNGQLSSISKVSLMDSQGRQLQAFERKDLSETMVLDLNNYSPGIYLLSILTKSNQILVKKLVVR